VKYETPILDIIKLEGQDVIRTSNIEEGDPNQSIPGGWTS